MEIKKTISIQTDSVFIKGDLTIPQNAPGIVVFAHGSGSNRLSPRNNYVAKILNKNNLATLLIDLLSEKETSSYDKISDMNFLSQRLIEVTSWLKENEETKELKTGYFGASTGAAAAIKAAVKNQNKISAIVSRGGRVDLADFQLSQIESPILLIVGENDGFVVELNEQAFQKINCTKELSLVPNASHLFQEPGTLEEVARLTTQWFIKYFKEN